jgi:dynein heavy chain
MTKIMYFKSNSIIRLDRVLFGAGKCIAANIGPEYVDPPSFDLRAVYNTSNCRTPLIFVLSSGVDPTAGIFQLANQMNQKVENCALDQEQASTAVKMIEKGVRLDNWVFSANCHLMLSWMSTIGKMIENIIEGNPHTNCRL